MALSDAQLFQRAITSSMYHHPTVCFLLFLQAPSHSSVAKVVPYSLVATTHFVVAGTWLQSREKRDYVLRQSSLACEQEKVLRFAWTGLSFLKLGLALVLFSGLC